MQAERLKSQDHIIGGNTDTSFLKLLALVFMLIDHIGAKVLTGVAVLALSMLGLLAAEE